MSKLSSSLESTPKNTNEVGIAKISFEPSKAGTVITSTLVCGKVNLIAPPSEVY